MAQKQLADVEKRGILSTAAARLVELEHGIQQEFAHQLLTCHLAARSAPAYALTTSSMPFN